MKTTPTPAEKFLEHLEEVEDRIDAVAVRLIRGHVVATSLRTEKDGKVDIYLISRDSAKGDYTCTCPAYKYGKDHWCKHMEKAARKGFITRPEKKVLGLA
jgi:uncharacterized Zn finger protein